MVLIGGRHRQKDTEIVPVHVDPEPGVPVIRTVVGKRQQAQFRPARGQQEAQHRQQFIQVVEDVEAALAQTPGPYFLPEFSQFQSITSLPFVADGRFNYDFLTGLFDSVDLGWLIYIPVCVFIITAVSNAVNLTEKASISRQTAFNTKAALRKVDITAQAS